MTDVFINHRVEPNTQGTTMDEDIFNTSVRKFLKKVGITSQKEIEKVIKEALTNGDIDQNSICKVSVQLKMDVSDKPLIIDGEIRLS